MVPWCLSRRWLPPPPPVSAAVVADETTLAIALRTSLPDIGIAAALVAADEADAVLFSESTDSLGIASSQFVAEQQPDGFVIVGGIRAISHTATAELRRLAPQASQERLAGNDRIHTAALAAHKSLGNGSTATSVIIANGWSLADVGAAAAAVAAGAADGVLYAGHDDLGEPTRGVLRTHRPSKILIAGGTAALSASVESAATDAVGGGVNTTRLGGDTRIDTAALLARQALPDGASTVVVADGWSLPDVGIAATIAAALPKSAVLYTTNAAGPVGNRWYKQFDAALRTLAPQDVVVADIASNSGAGWGLRDGVLAGISRHGAFSRITEPVNATRVALGHKLPPEAQSPGTGHRSSGDATRDILSVSDDHGCAIKTDETLTCWGDNTHGQATPPAGKFSAVAVSDKYSCAIRVNQTVACWGDDFGGRTNPPSGTYTDIVANAEHPCALRTVGTISCWGRSDTTYPGGGATDRPPSGTFADISLSNQIGCGVMSDSSMRCWGWTGSGLGLGASPTGSFRSVATGSGRQACAVRDNGAISCWGHSRAGASNPPAGAFRTISIGTRHSCALKIDQTIACWGDADDPLLVGATNVRSYGLTDAPTGRFRAIAASPWQSCALRYDDTRFCWGSSTPLDEMIPPDSQRIAKYLKANIIDRHRRDHPWLDDVWRYVSKPDFGFHFRPNLAFGDIHLEWTEPDVQIPYSLAVSLSVPDETYLSSEYDAVYIRILAKIYVKSANVRSDPAPLALAQLHLQEHRSPWHSWQNDCAPTPMVIETLVKALLPDEPTPSWQRCAALDDRPDQLTRQIVAEAIAGTVPSFLASKYGTSAGRYDYAKIWSCLVWFECQRLSATYVGSGGQHPPTNLIHQLGYAFGGYCSDQHVLNLMRLDYELPYDQPWRHGGCGNLDPTSTPGFVTASNIASRAVKSAVDELAPSHPWLRVAWDQTNHAEFSYIPLVRHRGIACPIGGGACALPGRSMHLPVAAYEDPDGYIVHPEEGQLVYRNPHPSTIVHELTHDFTLRAHDVPQAPTIAIGMLYLQSLAQTLPPDIARTTWCGADELYAQAAVRLVFPLQGGTLDDAFSGCPQLNSHSKQVVATTRDALNGVMPSWFRETFEMPNGTIDYVDLWQAVKNLGGSTVVRQLEKAFGGYCYTIDEVSSAVMYNGISLPGNAVQPWIDGGCT